MYCGYVKVGYWCSRSKSSSRHQDFYYYTPDDAETRAFDLSRRLGTTTEHTVMSSEILCVYQDHHQSDLSISRAFSYNMGASELCRMLPTTDIRMHTLCCSHQGKNGNEAMRAQHQQAPKLCRCSLLVFNSFSMHFNMVCSCRRLEAL
jgi:hypothetical protein